MNINELMQKRLYYYFECLEKLASYFDYLWRNTFNYEDFIKNKKLFGQIKSYSYHENDPDLIKYFINHYNSLITLDTYPESFSIIKENMMDFGDDLDIDLENQFNCENDCLEFLGGIENNLCGIITHIKKLIDKINNLNL